MTQEVAIEGRTVVINVTLNPDVLALDEVVVTAVGIQRATKSLGYSVTNIDAETTVLKIGAGCIAYASGQDCRGQYMLEQVELPVVQQGLPSGELPLSMATISH
jgi:hypothetical protein